MTSVTPGMGLSIAIMGTRGVPGHYGGFETFAEELGARLVQRGHRVTIYCRSSRTNPPLRAHRGMRLVYLPALRTKWAETLSHTLLSVLHGAAHAYDIVYVCNGANAPLCFVPWARGQKTVLNVDGLEWERAKWGRAAKAYYRWSARLASRMPIEVVTDARVIRDYYQSRLNRKTRFFPYGTDIFERGHMADRLSQFGLRPENYILYVSRLEPENNALLTVQAYAHVETRLPLAVVGDAPYAQEYIDSVRSAATPAVRFLGYRFGDDYHALQANARIYVQATEVGGTHPALVEALGHQNAIIAHDVPEHREVLGEAGEYFAYRDRDSLASRLSALLANPSAIDRYRELAKERAERLYSWDAVADAYLDYFRELV